MSKTPEEKMPSSEPTDELNENDLDQVTGGGSDTPDKKNTTKNPKNDQQTYLKYELKEVFISSAS